MADLVQGVTRLYNQLYILHTSDADQLGVYNTDCEHVRNISVPGLAKNGVCDIASCEQKGRLYLSNMEKGCIHLVVPKGRPISSEFSKWTLSEKPCGLSVTQTANLLVTCNMSRRLLELNSSGKQIRAIMLTSDLHQPAHSIQLAFDNFVLCCVGGRGDMQVCIVNSEGKVEQSYGSTRGSGEGQLSVTTHIAVDRDGFIFVADRDNPKVVMLSPSLQFAGLVLPNELQLRANHLYIDHADSRLYASSFMFDQRRSVVTVVQL